MADVEGKKELLKMWGRKGEGEGRKQERRGKENKEEEEEMEQEIMVERVQILRAGPQCP